MLRSPNRRHERTFFYKYTSASTAASILISKKVRLSSPLLFNDPFDTPRVLKLSFSGSDLLKGVIQEMVKLARDPNYDISANLSPFMQRYLSWMRSFEVDHYENLLHLAHELNIPDKMEEVPAFIELQQKWTDLLPMTRILCLAEENDNPVMWHTYADAYKGVVLQIDCIDIYDSFLLLAKQVIYSDEIPTIGSIDVWIKQGTGQIAFEYDAIFGQLEISKQTKWAYEKEWRVLSFEKDSSLLYSDYQLHPASFTKVFVGKDVTVEDRQLFLSLADHDLSNLEVYDMLINQVDRRIMFKRIK